MLLKIKVIASSPKNEVITHTGDTMRIKIKAPPEKGKANEELVKFLSKHFNVPQSAILLKAGKNSAKKIVEVKTFTS
jgi:uncharacterized protein